MRVTSDSKEAKGGWYVTSLARGLQVIRTFDRDAPLLKATEVAARAGLSRAAARRFLLTLQDLGYVGVDGDRWFLKPRVLDLGYGFLSSMHLNDTVQPIIDSVAEQTKEACNIAVLDGKDAVFVARSLLKQLLNINVSIGFRMPAHAGALGRVLLASLPQERIDEMFSGVELAPFASVTSMGFADLQKELEAVRRQGYATMIGELDYAIASIAVPIRDDRGEVIAAMNVATNVRRIKAPGTIEEFLSVLQHASDDITANMRNSPQSTFGRITMS